ncbi:MAG: ABC transporter substrate-binding protein, partial [Anaerolineales bacterium]
SEPYAPLLDSLSQVYLGIASPTALRTWGPQDYQFHQVGSGPFRFVEYLADDHITLAQNEGYRWASPAYLSPSASLAGVEFRFFVDVPTRALALESGQVDLIGEVPAHDARRLVDSGDFRLYPVAIPGQPMQILFHVSVPPTDDRRVRQALVLAVDRQEIVNTVFGGMSPVARGPLSAGVPGFAEDTGFPLPDPAAAAALLEDAGWRFEGGRRRRGGEILSLRLVVPNWGSHPEVAQLVAAAWEDVGAEVEIEVAAGFGPLREAQSRGDYHAIMLNFFGTDPDLLTPFYATGGLYNWFDLADPEVDELLAAGRTALDPVVRRAAYRRLAQRARDEAWILPIRDYVNLIVAHHRVQGMRFSPQGWFPYLIEFSLAP